MRRQLDVDLRPAAERRPGAQQELDPAPHELAIVIDPLAHRRRNAIGGQQDRAPGERVAGDDVDQPADGDGHVGVEIHGPDVGRERVEARRAPVGPEIEESIALLGPVA